MAIKVTKLRESRRKYQYNAESFVFPPYATTLSKSMQHYLGRSKSCYINIDDMEIAATQASIYAKCNRFYIKAIEDSRLRSIYQLIGRCPAVGETIPWARYFNIPITLKQGDVFRIGNSTFQVFEIASESADILQKQKDKTRLLLAQLNKHPLFCNLSEDAMLNLALSFKQINYKPKTTLIQRGKISGNCYFIQLGTVELGDGTTLTQNKFFNEYQLIRNIPHKNTITTKTDCIMLEINRDEMVSALGPIEGLNHYIPPLKQFRDSTASSLQKLLRVYFFVFIFIHLFILNRKNKKKKMMKKKLNLKNK